MIYLLKFSECSLYKNKNQTIKKHCESFDSASSYNQSFYLDLLNILS